MNYPLISEYIEAIKSAEDNFEELSYLRPILGDDGLPVMTSGNFAVVFKMKDEQSGKLYAVKCFTKEQEGRAEAYREIAKELKDVSSPYLVSIRYLEQELFVDTDQTTEMEFPVLLMDWVEGKPLDKYLYDCIQKIDSCKFIIHGQVSYEFFEAKNALEMLVYRFSQLAQWLIPQPFAHGDLKPDNILIREDGTLVLVDYDGMFVPAMKGQKSRELGSPDFSHPERTRDDFDEHIDDFSFISLLLSLSSIAEKPLLLKKYGTADRLLFSAKDYLNIEHSEVYSSIPEKVTKNTNYKRLLKEACEDKHFSLMHNNKRCKLTALQKPKEALDSYRQSRLFIHNLLKNAFADLSNIDSYAETNRNELTPRHHETVLETYDSNTSLFVTIIQVIGTIVFIITLFNLLL